MASKWYCLELWRVTPEMLALPHDERMELVNKHLIVSSEGAFEDGAFSSKAPISTLESLSVMLFFAVVMGGPVLVMICLFSALVIGSWFQVALAVVSILILAFHPLPDPLSMTTIRFTISLYKYFTYRFMWVDDVKEKVDNCKGWVGAGAPHGVLPLANFLSMPAINAFSPNRFLGGGASVTLYTPFLRYLTCLGGAIDVSKASLMKASKQGKCIGIVPDGIAGIFQQNANGAEERVALKERMGLAKLCLQEGIPIVPAYSLGNTAVFSSWYDRFGIMEKLSRRLKVSIFVFWGRWCLPIPKRTNISMLIGAPIRASDFTQDATKESVHQKILSEITAVFDLHKGACGWGHHKMVFV